MAFFKCQSPELTSLDMTKIQIISSHLSKMDEKRMENFKKALCQLKPRRGACRIKMGDLKNKSIKQLVEFVFRSHTKIRAAATIKMALEKINENQIKSFMIKDLGIAGKISKNVKTEKKEEPQEEVISKPETITNNMFPGAPLSHASSKKQPQVSMTQSNIANNTFLTAPNQQHWYTPSHTSSKEQPQVNQIQGNITKTLPRGPIEQAGVTPSRRSSKEAPPHVNLKQSSATNIIRRASNEQFAGAPSKEQAQVNPMQGNVTTMLPRGPNEQFQVTPSRTSSKEPSPQVNLKQSSAANITRKASNEQFRGAPSKEQPQVIPTQGNITTTLPRAPNEKYGTAPSYTSSKEQPQVNPRQDNITNTPPRAPDQQFGVTPSHTSSKEKQHINPTQDNITNNKLPMASRQHFGAHEISKGPPKEVKPEQKNITNLLFSWAPNDKFKIPFLPASSKQAPPQVNQKQSSATKTKLCRASKEEIGVASSKDPYCISQRFNQSPCWT